MHRIHVNFYINAPVERVFDAMADHEHFFRGGAIRSARVVRQGEGERNGKGAVREIHASGLRFLEEITCFERPSRFDYQITECTIPVNHEGGQLHFIDRGAGTEIDWISDYEIPIPLVGKPMEEFFERVFVTEFTRLTLQAKAELEG